MKTQTSAHVLQHLTRALLGADVVTDPFPHLCLQNWLPDAAYTDALRLLPASESYRELRHRDAMLPDGTSSRLHLVLSGRTLQTFAPEQKAYWESLYDVLKSDEVRDAMFTAHRAQLESRFGDELKTLQVEPRISLIRDLAGYKIGVHRDIPKKVITTQFYFPGDHNEGKAIGTVFYRQGAGRDYEFVRRNPYRANFGYSFSVFGDSFHGVDPLEADAAPRDSLMLTHYLVTD